MCPDKEVKYTIIKRECDRDAERKVGRKEKGRWENKKWEKGNGNWVKQKKRQKGRERETKIIKRERKIKKEKGKRESRVRA
jgi:hypothetical protein